MCMGILLFITGVVCAEQAPLDIHQTVEKEITVRKKIQQQEDQWAKQKQAFKNRYETLESQVKALKEEKIRFSDQLSLRRQKVVKMEQTIMESIQVKENLQSTLEDIVCQLDQFVETDLPFLKVERSNRISTLKKCLIDPDIRLAEKTRRTLEALQVELDYGRRLEVTEEIISIDGEKVAADVLRVGRLSLFCRTGDGSKTGWYVPSAESWQLLPDKYDTIILEAMEMASQRRPVDMINLPLGRLEVQ